MKIINLKISISFFAKNIFFLFMLASLLAPNLLINKIIFVVLLFWVFLIFIIYKFRKKYLVVPSFIIVGIFSYGYLLSLPVAVDEDLAKQLFFSSFIPLLIHFVIYYNIDVDRLAEKCGRTIAIVTFLYFLLVSSNYLPYASDIVSWYTKISSSDFSERDYLGDGAVLTLALSSLPFIFIPWCLVLIRLFNKFNFVDFVWIFIYAAVIVLGGARGVVVISFVFLFILIFLKTHSVLGRFFVLFSYFVFFVYLLNFLIAETLVFSGEETSNSVKIGHFQSFVDQLNWARGLFGGGLGEYYFSSGSGIFKSNTEITPLDLARYFGFPLAILLYVLLLFPGLKENILDKDRQLAFLAFFLYIILSFTNPVLINSIGMIVVIWYWSKYLKRC